MAKRFGTPLVLMIMDGLGNNPNPLGNAVAAARTPVLNKLRSQAFGVTELITCGARVGLPDGQMGNSEVGHLNIGGGRIVQQDLTRINQTVHEGTISGEQTFRSICEAAVKRNSALHLIGLVSTGGVHSSLEHLQALIDGAIKLGVRNIFIHAITDGRDRPPNASIAELTSLIEFINARTKGSGANLSIVSLIGRYFAMDRDNRWDRTKKAFDLFVHGAGRVVPTALEGLRSSHDSGTTDEFHEPMVIPLPAGSTAANRNDGRIRDNDVVLFFNFRADRMRQITRSLFSLASSLVEPFTHFARGEVPKLSTLGTLTEYEVNSPAQVIFPPMHVKNHLGEVLAATGGIHQLRTAETEKYAHVTYFFNGGVEEPCAGEERILIPSPRDVATYDQKPEMSAFLVTDSLIGRLSTGEVDVAVVNFANCDMVGHTGVFSAAVKAVETVDICVGRVLDALMRLGGSAIVTADHGNAEQMVDYETGMPHTFHTTYPVPLFFVGEPLKGAQPRSGGALCDIAPTILQILGIPQPPEMTGKSLLDSSS